MLPASSQSAARLILHRDDTSEGDEGGPLSRSQSPNSSRGRSKPGKPSSTSAGSVDLLDSAHISTLSRESAPSSFALPRLLVQVVALASFFTRFYNLHVPDEVIFDEVHFGKFTSYYLQRKYFFDVHPPLGRLLFAAVGKLVGFDGKFLFEQIGDSYTTNKVPYVALRSLPAVLSALTPPLAFETMRSFGFSLPACFLAAGFITFDTALVTLTRLIMLDASLIFFLMLSLYAWARFTGSPYSVTSNHHAPAFSKRWWLNLAFIGIALGCVVGVKMVGLLTIASIGMAVVFNLWHLLDHKVSSLFTFAKHFSARFAMLIVLPVLMYVFWFWIHLSILSNSGPGDGFMSPAFQASLKSSRLTADPSYITLGSNVSIKHTETNAFLHSHVEKYPLRYDNGRISSNGQQVTGYHYRDLNNLWRILPSDPALWKQYGGIAPTQVVSNQMPPQLHLLRHNDTVVLEHIMTGSHLLTHDVASPLMPTNQEFTTVAGDERVKRLKETLFRIDLGPVANQRLQDHSEKRHSNKKKRKLRKDNNAENTDDQAIAPKSSGADAAAAQSEDVNDMRIDELNLSKSDTSLNSLITEDDEEMYLRAPGYHFKLIHQATGVAMHSHSENLPQWAFSQLEINGNKNPNGQGNEWLLEEYSLPQFANGAEIPRPQPLSAKKKLGFFNKFAELQNAIFKNNAAMTKKHPYSSDPWNWAMMAGVISFWQKVPGRQIFMVPNVIVWGFGLASVVAMACLIVLHYLSLRRGVRNLVFKSDWVHLQAGGFIVLAYAWHYLPFYTMSRVLFMHHYLPAMVISCLSVGALFDYILKKFNVNPNTKTVWFGVISLTLIAAAVFAAYSPMVYGNKELPPQEWKRLKLFDFWKIHFTEPQPQPQQAN